MRSTDLCPFVHVPFGSHIKNKMTKRQILYTDCLHQVQLRYYFNVKRPKVMATGVTRRYKTQVQK